MAKTPMEEIMFYAGTIRKDVAIFRAMCDETAEQIAWSMDLYNPFLKKVVAHLDYLDTCIKKGELSRTDEKLHQAITFFKEAGMNMEQSANGTNFAMRPYQDVSRSNKKRPSTQKDAGSEKDYDDMGYQMAHAMGAPAQRIVGSMTTLAGELENYMSPPSKTPSVGGAYQGA